MPTYPAHIGGEGMSAGFMRRRNVRRRRHRNNRDRLSVWVEVLWQVHPTVLMVIVALIFSCTLIEVMETRLQPVLMTAARMQTINEVTAIVEGAILSELDRREIGYSDLVCVERDAGGSITAITTDMAEMNRLRSSLVEVMLEHVSRIDDAAIAIPVGSLVDSELLWGRGPTIKVRSFSVGTVSAEYRSEFSAAGVNQTLHKICLELSVPVTVLLPGTQMDVPVVTSMCVAETVIVGKVPSYIQKAYG